MSRRPGNNLPVIVIGAVVVLVIAQALNWALSISSFEKTYRESLVSRYGLIAKEFKTQVERDVNFGKPVHLLGNIRSIFAAIGSLDEDIKALYVTYPDGRIISSTETEAEGKILGRGRIPPFAERPAQDELYRTELTRIGGSYIISLPVYYDEAFLQGGVHVRFEDQLIVERIGRLIRGSLDYFALVLGVAAALLILLLLGVSVFSKNLPPRQARFAGNAAIIAALLAAQLAYASLNNAYFEKNFISAFEENVAGLSRILRNGMEKVLQAGIPVGRMKKAELLLAKSVENSRESASIGIADGEGNYLYYASQEGTWSVLENPEASQPARQELTESQVKRITPLSGGRETDGYLIITVNEKLIRDRLRELLYDALTILAVSLIFSLELIRLLSLLVRPAPVHEGAALPPEETMSRGLQIIRMASFVFFFAALIPLSFLPALIESVYAQHPVRIFSLSRETIVSLPIAAYMFGITLFIPATGFLTRRLSTKSIFLLSGGLFIAGTLLTAFAARIGLLVAARFIAGLGYGGTITNSTNLILRSTTEKNRSTGFGMWSAGFAAATICAISIGGVIVNRLGFTVGILVAAAAAVLLIVFYLVTLKSDEAAPAKRGEGAAFSGFKDLLEVFRNRSLVMNLLFSSVPFSLAYIGLFQYIFPLYMGSSGVSAADIGRILTIYGLISLATPLISRIADRIRNEKRLIIIGNTITGLSLLAFFLASIFAPQINPVLLLLPAILGIGLGGMMIDAVEESFIVSSREARAMGEAKLLSIYTTYDKIISIAVPVTAGILISGFGFTGSIGIIGAFTAAGVVFFALFARNLRSQAPQEAAIAGQGSR